VAYAITEQTGKALDLAVEEEIDGLWADKSAVTLIDVHQLICRDARNLTRRALAAGMATKLKGADMIHLATAMRNRATEIHSLEKRWYAFDTLVGVRIRAPFAAQQRLEGV
jgi:predicted nucleic acid-binding protein